MDTGDEDGPDGSFPGDLQEFVDQPRVSDGQTYLEYKSVCVSRPEYIRTRVRLRLCMWGPSLCVHVCVRWYVEETVCTHRCMFETVCMHQVCVLGLRICVFSWCTWPPPLGPLCRKTVLSVLCLCVFESARLSLSTLSAWSLLESLLELSPLSAPLGGSPPTSGVPSRHLSRVVTPPTLGGVWDRERVLLPRWREGLLLRQTRLKLIVKLN